MKTPIDYKLKYQELKLKFMDSVDVAFRLGYEQGLLQAQQENIQMQTQQAQQNQLNPGTDSQKPGIEGYGSKGSPAGEEQMKNPNGNDGQVESIDRGMDGSDLDKHISELESLLSKGELSPKDLMKVVQDLKKSQEKVKLNKEFQKSSKAIKQISYSLNKSQSLEKTIPNENSQIVEDLMKSIDKETESSQNIQPKIDISELSKLAQEYNIEDILKK